MTCCLPGGTRICRHPPCLPALLEAIGKVLVEKKIVLNGDELRFLRKRRRVASKDFAQAVGLSAEQYSRLENGATVTPTVDKLVCFIYATYAKFLQNGFEKVAKTKWTAELRH